MGDVINICKAMQKEQKTRKITPDSYSALEKWIREDPINRLIKPLANLEPR